MSEMEAPASVEPVTKKALECWCKGMWKRSQDLRLYMLTNKHVTMGGEEEVEVQK